MPGTKCIITNLKTEKKYAGKICVYVNGEFWKCISKDLVVSLGLHKDMEIHKEEFENIELLDEKTRALNNSFRLLSFRSRSVKEVRERLNKQGFSETVVDMAIDELEQRGYLNDKDFARMWISERISSRKYGKNWIKGELLTKGVDRSIIDAELLCYSEQAERDCARFLARKKYSKSAYGDKNKQLGSLYQYLAQRGFNNSISIEVVREIMSTEDLECESLE